MGACWLKKGARLFAHLGCLPARAARLLPCGALPTCVVTVIDSTVELADLAWRCTSTFDARRAAGSSFHADPAKASRRTVKLALLPPLRADDGPGNFWIRSQSPPDPQMDAHGVTGPKSGIGIDGASTALLFAHQNHLAGFSVQSPPHTLGRRSKSTTSAGRRLERAPPC
jgi:hypothetical protein